jgi:hypothetical protein
MFARNFLAGVEAQLLAYDFAQEDATRFRAFARQPAYTGEGEGAQIGDQ